VLSLLRLFDGTVKREIGQCSAEGAEKGRRMYDVVEKLGSGRMIELL
jgi:hypothetical protein